MALDCEMDALLADVVERARQARQNIRSPYSDPEEAWIDGFVEGWYTGHFKTPPVGIVPQKEEDIENIPQFIDR